MRVVIFSEKFWPEGSGGELATYLILKLLASTGDFELEVYTGTQKPAQIPGISIRTVEFLRVPNKIRLFFSILRKKQCIERIIEKADIVYIPRFSYPIIPIAKKLGKRVIVHLHGYQPVSYTAVILSTEAKEPMSDLKRTLILESRSSNISRATISAFATPLTELIRRWVNMADKIICVSNKHRELMSKLAPECRGKLVTVYNPLPELPNMRKNLCEKPTFLYSGGDNYIKGFYVLLEALRILGKRNQTNFKLILTNKYSSRSLRIIDHLKEKHRFDFQILGRVSYEKIIELHSQGWALLFPSIYEEPLPYAIIEASIAGTIPIVSKVGGIPEVISDSPAERFLIEPANPMSLAKRVLEIMLMSKREILSMGQNIREKILQKFNNNSIKRELIKVFNSGKPK